jgi:hypothetical protein
MLLVLGGLAGSGLVPEAVSKVPAAPPALAIGVPGEAAPGTPASPAVPEPAPVTTVSDLLQSGIVITVSLSSQKMHVFRDGVLWRSSPVSTGRKGERTPTGVFAILQKKRHHRSNLYSNAPMPFMQRLTWSGIAIHAGRLPGYPASHGCIRIPAEFAATLFKTTRPAATAVIVTDAPLGDGAAALALALAQRSDAQVPIPPQLRVPRPALAAVRTPAARNIPAAAPGATEGAGAEVSVRNRQTIQLAAARSEQAARARWQSLATQRPELRALEIAVIPAVVKGTQYYRLRATGPEAHATCRSLASAGIACFVVS